MAVPSTQGRLPVANGELYYQRAGQGPALVLVHSAFLDSRLWDPQFPLYARTHSVVRFDLRGHGRSSRDRSSGSDAADLVNLLNNLQIPQAYLLGNSVGASVVCEVAAGLPDRVPGLVLVGGTPSDLDPTSEEEAMFMDTFADREGELVELMRALHKPEAIEKSLDLWAPAAPPSERARLRTIAADNYDTFVQFLTAEGSRAPKPTYPIAASLKTGGTPILSITGAQDEPVTARMMARFAAETPSAHHVELPNGDHTPSVSSPGEFDAQVLSFLRTVEGGLAWPPPRD
jgi:3-oxoadipate enol-lactonase